MCVCSGQAVREVGKQGKRRGVSYWAPLHSSNKTAHCGRQSQAQCVVKEVCVSSLVLPLGPTSVPRLQLFQKAFKKGCTPLTVLTGNGSVKLLLYYDTLVPYTACSFM